MVDYMRLLLDLIRATVADRRELVAENVLLRWQLMVLARPTRRRPRPRRRWHGWVYGWRLHLVVAVAAVWIPLAATLTPANRADNEEAPTLLADLPELVTRNVTLTCASVT